jgi:hypothetical protein
MKTEGWNVCLLLILLKTDRGKEEPVIMIVFTGLEFPNYFFSLSIES